MTRFARPRGTAGMTLLELLVGLAVTGLVLAAGYGALASISDHRQRAAGALDEAARAAAIRRTLTEWIAAARLEPDGTGPEFRGVDAVDAGRDDDELTFLTGAAAGREGGVPVVRLFVDRDPATPERGLVAELGGWRGAARERVELAPAARGLQVRYLSALSRDPVWLPGWISSTVLPRALELRVDAAPDSLPPLLALPVAAALGDAR
ncbi:MAG TPA: prepilin-type N-terminal cleavage/methylation domain-containing protein [Longimicrobium sp.]